MNEEKLIKILLDYSNKVFPKKCNCCGKIYNSYREFLIQTKSIGQPVSYDEDFDSGDKKIKLKIAGTSSYFNCSCGSTLAIGTGKMNIINAMRMMLWSRAEAKRRRIPWREFVYEMRKTVHQRVLGLETWKKMNRILILDEDTYSSKTLMEFFQINGFDVDIISSEDQLLNSHFISRYKLIVINFCIVTMRLFEKLHHKKDLLNCLTVIAILDKFVSFNKNELIKSFKDIGVKGVLYKPFNFNLIKEQIRDII